MITGKNVVLRLRKEEELAILSERYNDILSRGDFYPAGLSPLAGVKKEFAENGCWSEQKGSLVICDKAGNALGLIAFFATAHYMDGYEIGAIIFDPEKRGKGIMREALALFCAFLFETKKIMRLQATHIEGNTASAAVLAKCGFQHEGLLRKAVYHRGEYRNLVMLSLLRDDCRSLKETVAGL